MWRESLILGLFLAALSYGSLARGDEAKVQAYPMLSECGDDAVQKSYPMLSEEGQESPAKVYPMLGEDGQVDLTQHAPWR